MMPLVGESSEFNHFIFTVAIGFTWNAAEGLTCDQASLLVLSGRERIRVRVRIRSRVFPAPTKTKGTPDRRLLKGNKRQ